MLKKLQSQMNQLPLTYRENSEMRDNSKRIEIYTDGACIGNPGPGGWGAIIINQNEERELSGNSISSTNNRMELEAVIQGLKTIEQKSQITVYTDSQYVQKGITEWIFSWKKNSWKTSTKKPVKNYDLWILLDQLNTKHNISWQWVKAHSGNLNNERVDRLARAEAESI